LVFFPVVAVAEFDFFLMVDDLNVSAHSDRSRFKQEVSLKFGVPVGKVERLIAELGSPGDAYLSLKIGKLSRQSVDAVVRMRQSSPGKGWGYIAKQMGIKPGSEEFMRLKQKRDKYEKPYGKKDKPSKSHGKKSK
jgi:hypothetical protein